MGASSARRYLRGLLDIIKTTSLVTLGPVGAFGNFSTGIVGGLFGCQFSIPFILCPICPAPCVFKTIRPWLFSGVVASSLVMGRVFCGLVCPIGILCDILYKFPVKKLHVSGIKDGLRYLKYGAVILFLYILSDAVLILIGLRSVGGLWSFMIVHRVEMVITITASVMILLISSTFIHRPWCRYICPIGTLISASNRFSLISFELNPEGCLECDACKRSCPMSLYNSWDSTDCVRCLSCFAECRAGIIRLKVRSK